MVTDHADETVYPRSRRVTKSPAGADRARRSPRENGATVMVLRSNPLWGNPVPTSGEIRDLRRRLDERFAPLLEMIERGRDEAATEDQAGDPTHGSQRRLAQLAGEPQVRRLLQPLLAAGRSGLDSLEHLSDETHDSVEESLARLSRWTGI